MRVVLIDHLPFEAPGAASELDALAASVDTDPVIAIADHEGVRRLNALGIDPIDIVTPSRRVHWQTRHVLERSFKRIGATSVLCRSNFSMRIASSLSGVLPVRPTDEETIPPVRADQRDELRDRLGLTSDDILLVPIADHPREIDAMVLALAVTSMHIAQTPVVCLLPRLAGKFRRARSFFAGADRVLPVVAVDEPSVFYTPAADAIIWGPHGESAHDPKSASRALSWARGFGVPLLFPHDCLDETNEPGTGAPVYACNGTGASDVAAPLLSIFAETNS